VVISVVVLVIHQIARSGNEWWSPKVFLQHGSSRGACCSAKSVLVTLRYAFCFQIVCQLFLLMKGVRSLKTFNVGIHIFFLKKAFLSQKHNS